MGSSLPSPTVRISAWSLQEQVAASVARARATAMISSGGPSRSRVRVWGRLMRRWLPSLSAPRVTRPGNGAGILAAVPGGRSCSVPWRVHHPPGVFVNGVMALASVSSTRRAMVRDVTFAPRTQGSGSPCWEAWWARVRSAMSSWSTLATSVVVLRICSRLLVSSGMAMFSPGVRQPALQDPLDAEDGEEARGEEQPDAADLACADPGVLRRAVGRRRGGKGGGSGLRCGV